MLTRMMTADDWGILRELTIVGDSLMLRGHVIGTIGDTGEIGWADILGKPSAYPPDTHTHDDRYYTEAEVDAHVSAKADAIHSHDDRYYEKAQVDEALAEKSDVTHGHTGFAAAEHAHDAQYYPRPDVDTLLSAKAAEGHAHDSRYYTEAETDVKLAAKADATHVHMQYSETTHDHDERYYTEAEVNGLLSARATASHSHDERYYTEIEVDTRIAAATSTSKPTVRNQSGVVANPVYFYGNVTTDANGVATIYLTSDMTVTGAALFSRIDYINAFALFDTSNVVAAKVVAGKALSADRKTLTVNVLSGRSVTLVGLTPTVEFAASGVKVYFEVVGA